MASFNDPDARIASHEAPQVSRSRSGFQKCGLMVRASVGEPIGSSNTRRADRNSSYPSKDKKREVERQIKRHLSSEIHNELEFFSRRQDTRLADGQDGQLAGGEPASLRDVSVSLMHQIENISDRFDLVLIGAIFGAAG